DADAMGALLKEDFSGELLNQPKEIRVHNDCVEVIRREDAGATPIRVARSSFVAQLLEYRRLFSAKPPNVQLVLKTLLPVVRDDIEGPWSGLAQLRLYGESRPGEPCEVLASLRYEVDQPTRPRLARPGWLRFAGFKQIAIARSSHYLMAERARKHGIDPSLFHDNWNEDPKSASSLRF